MVIHYMLGSYGSWTELDALAKKKKKQEINNKLVKGIQIQT